MIPQKNESPGKCFIGILIKIARCEFTVQERAKYHRLQEFRLFQYMFFSFSRNTLSFSFEFALMLGGSTHSRGMCWYYWRKALEGFIASFWFPFVFLLAKGQAKHYFIGWAQFFQSIFMKKWNDSLPATFQVIKNQ